MSFVGQSSVVRLDHENLEITPFGADNLILIQGLQTGAYMKSETIIKSSQGL